MPATPGPFDATSRHWRCVSRYTRITSTARSAGNCQVATLRFDLIAALKRKDIQAIAAGLVKKAKNGDVAAAKRIFAYSLGAPTRAEDPDTLDERELNIAAGYNKAEREAQSSTPDVIDRLSWSLKK